MLQRTPEHSAHRPGGPIYKGLAKLILCLGTLKAAYAQLIAPVPQPDVVHYVSTADPYHGFVPPPDTDIETLLQCNHETLHAFFQEHRYVPSTGFFQFFVTYRPSPEELQENKWQGPCSGSPEFLGEWAGRRGHAAYLVNLWPRSPLKALTTDWHQIGVICIEKDREYLIADNSRIFIHQGTLDAYVESAWQNHCIMQICGIRQWMRTQPNFFARTSIQLGPNEEMESIGVPLLYRDPIVIAATQ